MSSWRSSSIPTGGSWCATARPWYRKGSRPARRPGPTSSCSVLAGTARASAGSSSPDPLVANVYDAIVWNAYAYARNNPASYIDPTGRDFWKVFGMVLAAVAIIALIVVVSVFTFGIGTPGAIAIGGVTWGAIFTATMVGVVAGGVIGGIAAGARRW